MTGKVALLQWVMMGGVCVCVCVGMFVGRLVFIYNLHWSLPVTRTAEGRGRSQERAVRHLLSFPAEACLESPDLCVTLKPSSAHTKILSAPTPQKVGCHRFWCTSNGCTIPSFFQLCLARNQQPPRHLELMLVSNARKVVVTGKKHRPPLFFKS